MGVIYNTVLATSQPVSICYGFDYWPDPADAARLDGGIPVFQPHDTRRGILYVAADPTPDVPVPDRGPLVNVDESFSIVDIGIAGVDFVFVLKVEFGFFMGFCGPSWAMTVDCTGETFDGGTAVCQFTGDNFQAGFALGCAAYLTLHLRTGFVVWYDVLVDSGEFDIFVIEFTLEIKFDILGTIIGLIQKALEDDAPDAEPGSSIGLNSILPPPGFFPNSFIDPGPPPNPPACYGFFDQTNGVDKVLNKGKVSLEPIIEVEIDVSPFIPYIKQLKEIVEAIGGELASGPKITIGFPIVMTVEKLILDDADTYNVVKSGGEIDPVSDDPGLYQQQLAEAAIEAYRAKGWFIPQLPQLLAIAGRTVLLGIYPDTTTYLSSLIRGADGTVPAPPAVPDGLAGNALGFDGGPDTAARLHDRVKLQLKHTPSVGVTLSFFITIELFGLAINFDYLIESFDVGDLFGFNDPSLNELDNVNGGQYVGKLDEQSRFALLNEEQDIRNRFVDVVFEVASA